MDVSAAKQRPDLMNDGSNRCLRRSFRDLRKPTFWKSIEYRSEGIDLRAQFSMDSIERSYIDGMQGIKSN